MSPSDLMRLVAAVLALGRGVDSVVWGMSANTRGIVDLSAGRAIGFDPVDDAEVWALDLGSPPPLPRDMVIGDVFARWPLGERMDID